MKKLKNSMRHPFTWNLKKKGVYALEIQLFFKFFFALPQMKQIVTQIIDNN